jgi:hypothetical protein
MQCIEFADSGHESLVFTGLRLAFCLFFLFARYAHLGKASILGEV